MSSRVPDVLIVGGGAIGGSIALAMASRGASVTVLEGGRVGRGASWAAAGALVAEWGSDDPPALTSLARDSLALWPEFAEEVQGRSGVGLNYREDGLLNLWLDPDAPALPRDLATEPPPGPGQRLTAAEVREREPSLSGPILGGVFDPTAAQVDNPRLAPALLRAAADLGASVVADTPVAGLLGDAGRCRGVRSIDGREWPAGAVVLAAGAWSGPLAAAAGIELPVVPWRGQMLTFETTTRPFQSMVFCGELVLIPRPHGPLIVGTTLENVGFDGRVTLAGLHEILARTTRVAPGLGDLPLLRTWAGLRPGTPDGLPYLGPIPGWAGLFAASGHGRKGIILTPITGPLIASLVLEGVTDPRMIPFLPGRTRDGRATEKPASRRTSTG
ncbi:MAG: glycine oxidase ThiO [Isosphaeraceae bacterium]